MDHIQHGIGGTAFVGAKAVAIFRAKTIASALTFYARTGMQVNRAYTPSGMMMAAAAITGKHFKARDYTGAAQALHVWCEEPANSVPVVKEA